MMTILMMIVGFVVGAYFGGDPFSGIIVFLFISILINIFSYFYSDSIVLRAYGAKIIERQDNHRLYDMVKKVADINALPMPRIAIVVLQHRMRLQLGETPKRQLLQQLQV